jgi:hypothetical protein
MSLLLRNPACEEDIEGDEAMELMKNLCESDHTGAIDRKMFKYGSSNKGSIKCNLYFHILGPKIMVEDSKKKGRINAEKATFIRESIEVDLVKRNGIPVEWEETSRGKEGEPWQTVEKSSKLKRKFQKMYISKNSYARSPANRCQI